MNKKFRILLFPSALLTMMCLCPNLDTLNFAKDKPAIIDLSGKYTPTQATLKNIVDEGHYNVNNIFILLSPDGNFELKNMPDWWLTSFGQPQDCLISGQGNWKIEKQQEWWELKLDFLTGKNLCVEEFSAGFTTSVPISGDATPYSLWLYVGDPDSGHVMIFEKVSDK